LQGNDGDPRKQNGVPLDPTIIKTNPQKTIWIRNEDEPVPKGLSSKEGSLRFQRILDSSGFRRRRKEEGI
jgi:hypothetical protein